MEGEQQQDPPASTRLPTELRLEIWKHYFAAIEFEYTGYRELSGSDQCIPHWHPDKGWQHQLGHFITPAQLPSLRSMHYTGPALLKTCKAFRAEALPIYLERLKKELEEAKTWAEYVQRKRKEVGVLTSSWGFYCRESDDLDPRLGRLRRLRGSWRR